MSNNKVFVSKLNLQAIWAEIKTALDAKADTSSVSVYVERCQELLEDLQSIVGSDDYDSTATYNQGDYCVYDGKLYFCTTNGTTGTWNAAYWEQRYAMSEIAGLLTAAVEEVGIALGASTYSEALTYAVGDYCVYSYALYRCTTAISTPESWNASHWTQVSITSESARIITEIQAEGATQVANVQSVYADDMAEVNAKVSRNTKEIANLIQKEGEVSISYPDSVYGRGEVPSGMAKFAEVKTLRGVTRVANQLLDKSFGSSTTINNVTFTNNGDGSWSISTNGTASGTAYVQLCNDVPTLGHKWLIAGCPSGGSGLSGFTLWDASNSAYDNGSGVVFSPTNAINVYIRVASGTSIPTPIVYWPVLTDLNVYFGSDPSVDVSALTIADIQQNYPELLIPSAYDTGSIVDITYSAVESEGVNLWDEEWEIGSYSSTGQKVATQGGRIRSVNKIPALPNTSYYALKGVFILCQYDENEDFISFTQLGIDSSSNVGHSFTTEANTHYLAFATYANYGTTYNHDIQICLNSYVDKTTYHPYIKSTLTLPSPVTLRSAGSVADTDELCVEVDGVERRRQTKNVASVDLSTITFKYNVSLELWLGNYVSGVPFSTQKKNLFYHIGLSASYAELNADPNILGYYMNDSTASSAERIYIRNGSNSVAPTGILYYESPNPTVTLSDPILDNFVPTEAGGTITPKQTQTKQIDTSFDVNYLAL